MQHPGKIVSLQIGQPSTVDYHGQSLVTAMNKTSVDTPVFLTNLGFTGDGQADLKHHGGREKAVCVYPVEHYPYWQKELNRALPQAAFGENLTVEGMVETVVCIGDILQVGEAVVQVTQPRQPCYKLAKRYHDPKLPLKVQDSGFTGYYLRVLQEGWVSKEHSITLLERHPLGITVDWANQLMHQRKDDLEGIEQILAVEELSDSWQKTFSKRLQGERIETKTRLEG